MCFSSLIFHYIFIMLLDQLWKSRILQTAAQFTAGSTQQREFTEYQTSACKPVCNWDRPEHKVSKLPTEKGVKTMPHRTNIFSWPHGGGIPLPIHSPPPKKGIHATLKALSPWGVLWLLHDSSSGLLHPACFNTIKSVSSLKQRVSYICSGKRGLNLLKSAKTTLTSWKVRRECIGSLINTTLSGHIPRSSLSLERPWGK